MYNLSQSTFKRLRLRNGQPVEKQIPSYNKGHQSCCTKMLLHQSTLPDTSMFSTKWNCIWKRTNKLNHCKKQCNARRTVNCGMLGRRSIPSLELRLKWKAASVTQRHEIGISGYSEPKWEKILCFSAESYNQVVKLQNDWAIPKVQWWFCHLLAKYTIILSEDVRNRWGLGEGKKMLWTMRWRNPHAFSNLTIT